MWWKTAARGKDNMTSIPKSWIGIHYYEALNTLFRIENSLRVFVYVILKNKKFDKWTEISVTSDDTEPSTIKAIANRRVHQAQDFGYLGYVINCPLMYLTSGELIRLITDDNNWLYFNEYFHAKKDIIKSKLDEISVIRNSLAHFRPMKPEDVGTINQNANHTLTGVEDCLYQLGQCYNVVPTNTTEKWYKALSTIGNELCSLRLEQCNDEQWVTLQITYKSKTLSTNKYSDTYYNHTILNIISPSILTKYKNLARYVTFLREGATSSANYSPENVNFIKEISLLFSRNVLNENYESIKKDIEDLLNTITEETDLIQNDHLARGELISAINVTATFQTSQQDPNIKWWSTNTNAALNPLTNETPPEYWGNIWLFNSMVTSIHTYPWMPVWVSEIDFTLPVPPPPIPLI